MANVLVKKHGTNEVIETIACESDNSAETVERGLNINLNHAVYYTEIVGDPKEGDLRMWWKNSNMTDDTIDYVSVTSVDEAVKLIDARAEIELKDDSVVWNTSGLEVYESDGDTMEWCEYYDAEGRDIEAIMYDTDSGDVGVLLYNEDEEDDDDDAESI